MIVNSKNDFVAILDHVIGHKRPIKKMMDVIDDYIFEEGTIVFTDGFVDSYGYVLDYFREFIEISDPLELVKKISCVREMLSQNENKVDILAVLYDQLFIYYAIKVDSGVLKKDKGVSILSDKFPELAINEINLIFDKFLQSS